MGALSPNSSVPWEPVSPVGKEELYVGPHLKDEKKKTCGLGKRTFTMVLVAVIVLIGAAVGGGVAGVMRAKHGESSPPKTTTPATNRTSSECVASPFTFCLLSFPRTFANSSQQTSSFVSR